MAQYARRIVRFVDGRIESDERNPHPHAQVSREAPASAGTGEVAP